MVLRRSQTLLDEQPLWLKLLSIPLSAVYRMLTSLHRGLYLTGFRRKRKLPRPVVSVGNLSVGGTGKTPLAIWIARKLKEKGIRVAVLSRGYGRRRTTRDTVLEVDSSKTGPDLVGDEPVLIAQSVPEVPVYVSADRYLAGMKALSTQDFDLFLLDDGFQHHRLARDLDIVVMDDRRRLGNGHLLPWGILREPVSRLLQADIVVMTKADRLDEDFGRILSCLTPAQLAWTGYRPKGITPVADNQGTRGADRSGIGFFLFSGIADPVSFERTVEEMSLRILGRARYPDHHRYQVTDVRELERKASAVGADALLTTEKDAVRWPAKDAGLPCYRLEMSVEFLSGEDPLVERVMAVAAGDGR